MTSTADKLSPFVATSAVLHASLVLLVVLAPSLFPKRAETSWGTTTPNGVPVGVASSLPGIPLPAPRVVTETAKPNDSKALHPADPAPKKVPKAPASPAAIKIPERGGPTETKPSPPSRVAKTDTPPPANVPPNAIPGPESGQTALPYGNPGAGQGRATFSGDGTFGTRFPEYVTAMTRAIELQWIKPGALRAGQRVYVTFTISRNGRSAVATEVTVKPEDRSGSAQLDSSALRAVMAATLPPLPSGFSGSSVDVRFYFDYTR